LGENPVSRLKHYTDILLVHACLGKKKREEKKKRKKKRKKERREEKEKRKTQTRNSKILWLVQRISTPYLCHQ
jgi:hypothetical protein